MESGPGKEDPDARIKIPAHWHRPGQRDYSNAHASTGAQSAVPADGSPPPPRPASLVGPPKERVHEQAGGGSRGTKGSSSAAAGVHQRNKKVGGGIPSPALYPPSSVRRSPSNPLADDDAAYGPGAGLSSPAVGSDKGKGVAWRHPIVTETMTAPQEVRPPPDPFDCKLVFEELFQEQAKINRVSRRWAEQEETQKQVKPTDVKETLFRKLKNYFTRKKEEKPGQFIVRTQPKRGKLFWSQVKKIFDRGGRQSYEEHVCYQTIPIREVWNYYPRLHHRAMGLTPCRPSHMAVDQAVVPFNVTSLDAYSEFRRVLGDGECFYRSFIFSYLEQVLDWQDINEEDRLLAVVNRVATQHANLGWTSEFTRSQKEMHNSLTVVAYCHSFIRCDIQICKLNNPLATAVYLKGNFLAKKHHGRHNISEKNKIAFQNLIKKVIRWKTQDTQGSFATTGSCRKQKLLKFFNTYDTTEDIFVFLRLLAAIWICSHSEEYEPLIPGVRGNYDLKNWCTQNLVLSRQFTDHVQMRALASALEIPLKVEQLRGVPAQDIYTAPGVSRVSVTLLYTAIHYDIIYPRPPDGQHSPR